MNYENLCRKINKKFSWITNVEKLKKEAEKKVSQEFLDSLNFTGLDLEPWQIILFSYASAFISFLFALFLDLIILAFYGFDLGKAGIITFLLMFIITIGLPIFTLHFISEYPKIKARHMKIHSLGDIPEVLSYIVMYLKLIPNLENAFRFAAKESNTSLGKDLRKLMWDLEIRIHKSIEDAITYFANLWGKWSDYLKRAFHLVRSSVHERDEGQRTITLDRALDVVLDGTKATMVEFANKLHQPTLVIYSIGVMIPLALVAMLPAVGLVGFSLSIFQVLILYDIILPILLFIYIRKVLLERPATFNPPHVPSSHPYVAKINRKANFTMALTAGILLSLPGIIFMLLPLFPLKGGIIDFISKPAEEGGLNAYFPVTLFILWGFTAFVSIYCLSTYSAYKKVRDEIKEMEKEFSDSLYVLGKRIMEGKPAEEAFAYASEALKGSKMGELFGKTFFNLQSMRMNTNDALFDKKFGSLKHVYSDRIKAIMKLFVEGIKKSYVAAGVAIVKIADHLKQLQDVERNIKNALGTLTSTLKTTATVFAPMIAGVTLGIAKLIYGVMSKIDWKIISEENSQFLFGSPKFSIENVKPEYLVLVVGIYIILLVLLLIRFANGIDEGDDRIQYLYELGKALPTAVFLYSIVTIMSMFFFQGMAP